MTFPNTNKLDEEKLVSRSESNQIKPNDNHRRDDNEYSRQNRSSARINSSRIRSSKQSNANANERNKVLPESQHHKTSSIYTHLHFTTTASTTATTITPALIMKILILFMSFLFHWSENNQWRLLRALPTFRQSSAGI